MKIPIIAPSRLRPLWGWGCSSVAICMLSMHEALGFVPSTAKEKTLFEERTSLTK
jgi:hypothetical protein